MPPDLVKAARSPGLPARDARRRPLAASHRTLSARLQVSTRLPSELRAADSTSPLTGTWTVCPLARSRHSTRWSEAQVSSRTPS